jgi:hypothetical protein
VRITPDAPKSNLPFSEWTQVIRVDWLCRALLHRIQIGRAFWKLAAKLRAAGTADRIKQGYDCHIIYGFDKATESRE